MSAIASSLLNKSCESEERLIPNFVYCGDSGTFLRTFPDNSIDAIITSPPYFQQRAYTGIGVGMERTVTDYLDALMESFIEMYRVIKPTGSIIYNIGDKIDGKKGGLLIPYHFAIRALREITCLKLLNHITWVKANPVPRQFKRRLVSSTEPFFHFVKTDKYYYAPHQFFNKEAVRPKCKSSSRIGQIYFEKIAESNLTNEEKAMAIRDVNQVIEEVKSNKIEGFRMKIRGMHAPAFGGQEGGRNTQMKTKGYTIIRILGEPMKKDVIMSPVETLKGACHPAVFPLQLIRELVKLTCPSGGVVLDPYCGSGTTLVAAVLEDRKYVGIDISSEYCNFSLTRVKSHGKKQKTIL